MKYSGSTFPKIIGWIIAGWWCGLTLAACGESQPAPTNQPVIAMTPAETGGAARSAEEADNIREAVLRYRFSHSVGGPMPSGKFYCISLSSTMHTSNFIDPDEAFLRRFDGNIPPVIKASGCTVLPDRVIAKDTGEKSMIFGVDQPKWLSDTEAEIEASYCGAEADVGGTVYQLKKENNRWSVQGSTRTWIS
jgi:hypothetical protein